LYQASLLGKEDKSITPQMTLYVCVISMKKVKSFVVQRKLFSVSNGNIQGSNPPFSIIELLKKYVNEKNKSKKKKIKITHHLLDKYIFFPIKISYLFQYGHSVITVYKIVVKYGKTMSHHNWDS
jgi:hypothetical protein